MKSDFLRALPEKLREWILFLPYFLFPQALAQLFNPFLRKDADFI